MRPTRGADSRGADGLLVLHAIWSWRSVLYLWGEDADRLAERSASGKDASSSARPSPRKGRAGSPPPHPFAASLERVAAAACLPGVADERADHPVLLLPGAAGVPFPSRPLRSSWVPPTRAKPRLAPWRVPALAIPAGPAADVLLALPEGRVPGLVVGDSVRLLARTVQVALELAAAGRVLPGLAPGPDGRLRARWLPVPGQEQAERLRLLVEAMPPVCRAELVDGASDGRHPDAVLSDMVGAVVDDVARSALAGRRLLPPRRGKPPRVGRAAEAFVAALASPDPTVDADPGELHELERALEDWHRSGIRPAGPVRTCFRLGPPEEEAGSWRIEFLLQSTEDPSLLIPAGQVWGARRRLAVLEGALDHPQERLLADLGHASRLYPALDGALDVPRPVELATDAAGAQAFLREAAPLLEQAGFGVLVPSWWRSGGARIGVR
ncbi:MAG: hypothetical protein HYU54_09260, partial [Actinobacteria bacterium]|nr:hypothetical protein [Actinomycetota bacterium]